MGSRDHGRNQRVAEEIRRILSELLLREVKDPRVNSVTITEVEVARDLSHAKVFYSSLDPDADREAIQVGLKHTAGFLRSQLAKRMSTRTVPRLDFRFDTALEQGAHMGRVLRELDISDPEAEDADPSGDEDGSA